MTGKEIANYSVCLVKDCVVDAETPMDPVTIYEEVIVLCKMEEGFFANRAYREIPDYFNEKIPQEKYINANNEEVCVSVVAVIDYFEILDSVIFEDMAEVYSRHFIEPPGTELEVVISKYYSDFSLEKALIKSS
ncbi:MAG: hypothetical protein Q4D65_01070 [Peptostreptococcaceae bacterium]|nr:hypothetical protein [Peptostreptococcaceae bacterium]